MEPDIPTVVHQDTTLNVGKLALVLPLAGIVAILSAGVLIGNVQSDISALQDEVRAVRIDMQSRESKDAVSLMFGEVRTRLGRIEVLLDRSSPR